MNMLGFILIIGVTIPAFIFISKALSSYGENSLSHIISEKIDAFYDNWVKKNPVYQDNNTSNNISNNEDNSQIDQVAGGVDELQDMQQEVSRRHQMKRVLRTGILIAIYMLVCNILIRWGSLKELIIGSFIGVCVAAGHGSSVQDPKFVQQFAVGALTAPVFMIVVRNYIDTYQMGLWIFTLSGPQLYLSQWLGILFYYLICRSREYHKNLKNIFALWIMIIFTIYIL